MIKLLSVIGAGGLALVGIAMVSAMNHGQQKGATMNSHVGNRPGNIGTATDIDAAARAKGHELAEFSAGCFWHVESSFRKIPGVVATAVGYSGGHTANPTYEKVCSHTTGHAETVLVEFDPKKISYTHLLGEFWKLHDPTQVNRQGPDYGDQYRSSIFYRSEEQHAQAEASKAKEQASGKYSKPIATAIVASAPFTLAEEYHQQYFEKNGIDACGIGG